MWWSPGKSVLLCFVPESAIKTSLHLTSPLLSYNLEAMYQSFQGTDAEFVKVAMPSPTLECLLNRIGPGDRCLENQTRRIGHPLGICDEGARSLTKLMTRSLHDSVNDMHTPEAIKSPAYEALKKFQISNMELDQIFSNQASGCPPREAVCDFLVATNAGSQLLQAAVPLSYPRMVQEKETDFPLLYGSTLLAGAVFLMVLWTGVLVYRTRKQRVIAYAQVEFLFLLLAGSLTLSIGALIMGLAPTNAFCVAQIWLVNIGYAFELVPLIVKVAALNRVVNAARRLRRTKIRRTSLFGAVFIILIGFILFLTIWTILDPPHKTAEYELSDPPLQDDVEVSPEHTAEQVGEIIAGAPVAWLHETNVNKFYHCQSDSNVWRSLAIGWQLVLLLSASVLAFQTRNVQSQFNESRALAMLIYSHFVFVVLQIVVAFCLPAVSASVLARFQSIMISCDTFATLVIYFVPKFTTQNTFVNRSSFAGVSEQYSSMRGSNFQSQTFNPLRVVANISAISTFSGRHRAGETSKSSHPFSESNDDFQGDDDSRSPSAADTARAKNTKRSPERHLKNACPAELDRKNSLPAPRADYDESKTQRCANCGYVVCHRPEKDNLHPEEDEVVVDDNASLNAECEDHVVVDEYETNDEDADVSAPIEGCR